MDYGLILILILIFHGVINQSIIKAKRFILSYLSFEKYKLSKFNYMSSFADEKESTGSNIRKELALNNDHEIKELLNETEHAKYIEDLDNDRDLTFKDRNIMDYSKNEINSFSPEDKMKFRKLKILQTKIKQEMLRHNIKVRKQKIEKLENEKKEKERKEMEERVKLDNQIQELLDQYQKDNSNEKKKDENFKRLYNKYKNKYLKLKEQLN